VVNETFLAALLADFKAHGASVIRRLADENPAAYMELCLAVIRTDIRISVATGDATGEVWH
jgi:hypothetical protein